MLPLFFRCTGKGVLVRFGANQSMKEGEKKKSVVMTHFRGECHNPRSGQCLAREQAQLLHHILTQKATSRL